MKKSVIDRHALEAININGFDLVMFAINVTIETVDAVSKDRQETEQRLTDLANALHGFAADVDEPRLHLLFTQLAKGLIGTEKTA